MSDRQHGKVARAPAISLWQPWASLWLATPRVKINETRHWRLPARYIGQRVLVHAALKRITNEDLEDELLELACRAFPVEKRPLPRGGFIGSIVIADCVQMVELANACASFDDLICGNWEEGRYAWRGEDPRTFDEMIPAKGQQGWWTAEVPAEAAA